MKTKRYIVSVKEVGEEIQTIPKRWELTGPGHAAEYGYTPETESTQLIEREIFRQTVNELDLAALVSTVNGLSK